MTHVKIGKTLALYRGKAFTLTSKKTFLFNVTLDDGAKYLCDYEENDCQDKI